LFDPISTRPSEAVGWLRGYLRIDTTNPPGNETPAARYLESILRREGIECEVFEAAPGRGNLIARLPGRGGEPAIVLNSHIDVVAAGSEKWKRPPFAAAILGGRIYGRGAIDVKGPGMVHLAAFVELKRSGIPLDRDVVLTMTADEENGGHLGVEALLERRPELFRNVGAVLGEGGGNDVVVDKVQLWKIEIAQKRPLWLRLTARGLAGHGAVPEPGTPSHRLLRGLAALLEWKPEPKVSDLLDSTLRLQSRAKLGRKREVLADIRKALRTNPQEIRTLFGEGLPALFVPTVAIGRFHGSSNTNVLPAVATADVDLRIRPDDDATAILAEVKRILAPHQLELEILESAPPVPATKTDGEIYRRMVAFLEREEPGSVAAPMIQQGFSDGRHFRARGIPVYGFLPLKVNYYDLYGIHGVDEKIRADFFDEGVRRMTRLLSELAGRGERRK
jgi:acetylornithine deacetylase/succinyl-diaminopimelate desuccinylase-like protein